MSSPLQTREDELRRTSTAHIPRRCSPESKACTVQECIEITVPLEVVWLTSDPRVLSNPRRCAVTHSTARIPRRCSPGIQGLYSTRVHRITVPLEVVWLTSDLESSSNPRRCAVTHSTARIPRRCSPGIQDMYSTNEHRNNRNTNVHSRIAANRYHVGSQSEASKPLESCIGNSYTTKLDKWTLCTNARALNESMD